VLGDGDMLILNGLLKGYGSMAIEIKVLGSNDAGVLMNIAPGVFDNPIDPRMTNAFLNNSRHHLAVAVERNLVVGFVSAVHYTHPHKPHPELWINEVGVAPTHQCRGLGNDLLRSMLEAGRSNGCSEAWARTDRSNTPAIRLYSSNGGTESDQVMFTFRVDNKAKDASHP
jgi:ribosomal protein S18 acetylase RimI-like enzyme